MKKILYLECYSGISGDMTVASLLDLGADRKVLEDALASLHVDGYEIKIGRTFKCGIDACDFDVILDESAYVHDHEHHHDHAHEHHHHDGDDHDHCHDHEHHHGDHDDEHCHDHDHHHNHDHEEHHHHHADGEECHCHDHEHHHHHADDVFTSWGTETGNAFTKDKLKAIFDKFEQESKGTILRSKGIVKDAESDQWIYFDYVPGQFDIRMGNPDYTGKVVVIAAGYTEDELKEIFLG